MRVLADFARSLQASDLAAATCRGYAADLGRFRAWVEDGRGEGVALRKHRRPRPGQLSPAPHPDRKAPGRQRQPQSPGAPEILRLGQAQKAGPPQSRRPPCASCAARSAGSPGGFAKKKFRGLLRAAGQSGHGLARRNYALLQLLLQTGLRVGEASRLAIADCQINARSGMVLVRAGKGGKEREVPLNAGVRRALAQYLKTREGYTPHEPLFLSERGSAAMSLRGMQATVQELARRAGITRIPVSAHTCRHSFALAFMRRNPGKLIELATLLGHESLDTTAVYLHPSTEELAQAVEEDE